MPYGKGTARLCEYARELGYRFVKITGGGHILVRHPDTGAYRTFSMRVDEGSRDFANMRADLVEGAGQSNQGRAAVIGERREKPKPRPATVTRPSESDEDARAARRAVLLRSRELSALDHLMRRP